MAKNPFKKANLTDTIINVGIGGAANVAVDYAIAKMQEGSTDPLTEDTINLAKFAVGAVGSSMVSNKMLKAAMDGFAVVGISNYISKLLNDSATTPPAGGTTGLPHGTVGKRYIPSMKPAARKMARNVSGVPAGTVNGVQQYMS